MAGVKFERFLGKAPRIAPELLPDMAAQTATNVKLYSGNLIPYPQPVVVGNNGFTGIVPKTLYALYDPADNPVWLVWATDVDIATPSGSENVEEQRFYYTGDGPPKVSTYALATSGAAPYPADYYDLGLPLPTQKPTASAAVFTTKTTATYARDAGGLVTMTTSTAHGLKTGAFVTISGFTNRSASYNQIGAAITVSLFGHGVVTGSQVFLKFTSGGAVSNLYTVTATTALDFTVVSTTVATTSGNVDWDITNLNALTVKVTVTNSTTFTYTSPGFQVSAISSSDGRVDLAGDTQARSYLYTWYTPWDEESIGSEPSTELFIKEGQVVTISNLPTARPAGKNQIRGIRLYRTLSTIADTEYLRLGTLFFPADVAGGSRTSNVSTVSTYTEHMLQVGDGFKLSGIVSDASFNITGGIVTAVVDDNTFQFNQLGSDVPGFFEAPGNGKLFYDVSENPGTTTPRYWGDGSYDFIDDFNVASLLNALLTDDYDAPPAGLKGLTLYNNNILVGFVGNEVYFSEPGQYHAWPRTYKKEISSNIVGLAVFSGYLLIATEDYPHLITGSDPSVLSLARIDARYPCLNKNSIANMGFGVMYATHDGLALYSTTTGPQLATRLLYNSDTWNADLDPSTLIGTAYKDTYLAWHSTGGISFERDEKVGGFFVDLITAQSPEATWYDPLTNNLYYAAGTSGDVYLWDDLTQPAQPFEWKSKVMVTNDTINIGAAQVDADYAATSPVWDLVTETWGLSTTQWNNDGGITFKLWVDGVLVSTQQLDNRNVFRLPRGYRSDKFEISVEGSVQLKSIRIAETPTGLREI